MRTDTVRLLLRGASHCFGLPEPPPLARAAAGCRRADSAGAALCSPSPAAAAALSAVRARS